MQTASSDLLPSGTCRPLSVGQCASLACLLEATSPKPGNVHRGADFEDLTFYDFLASGVAIGPPMDEAATAGVGRAVLSAIQATRQLVGTNTNLGAVLLLAPLAAVPRHVTLSQGVGGVLKSLSSQDALQIYEAIRLACPGGLGRVSRMDVSDQPPPELLAAMRDAADRDLVARQYANNFQQVLGHVAPGIVQGRQHGWSLPDAVAHEHLRLMAEFPDSLIARKCGWQVAQTAAGMASNVLAAGHPGESGYERALADLDFWLRSDGHRRNPGTSADLIAAGLFVVLRDGLIGPPYR